MVNIKIKNLNKKYDKTVIDDLNLQINSGEFCVILGPSGCGKSTLLEIIAGLEDLDSGEIYFNQENVTKQLPSKRKVSMIFQDYALYPNMTVFENVEFALKIKKVRKEKRKEEVLKTLKLVDLTEYIKKYPHELSGGQRQRVAIARALITKPNVFLMDEPLSNLDTNLKDDLRKEIVSIHKEIKSTTVYVTHDKNEALNMADKIVVLNNGKLQQIGTCKEVLYNPLNLFVFQFLHTNSNVFTRENFENIFKIKTQEKTYKVGIKSEDILIEENGQKFMIKDIKLEEDRKVFYLENNLVFKYYTNVEYKIGDLISVKIMNFLEFDKEEKTL